MGFSTAVSAYVMNKIAGNVPPDPLTKIQVNLIQMDDYLLTALLQALRISC